MSCLVADVVAFNSAHNRDSFLGSIVSFLNKMPDHRPKHIGDEITAKGTFPSTLALFCDPKIPITTTGLRWLIPF